MRTQPIAIALALVCVTVLNAQQIDYAALWDKATPFDQFLAGVKAQEDKWRSRFANAAIDAQVLNDVRALPDKRRILVVAADTCSDSAWAVPYVAKLAAAVPERLELRVIGRKEGSPVQSANLTTDGRLATPTFIILDENNSPTGAWVERPAELQKWVTSNRASVTADELHEQIDRWQKEDDGKSTLKEILALLQKQPAKAGN
ncbi:MAG: thioredoxin family protein [Vicinamibacterales bacterium]